MSTALAVATAPIGFLQPPLLLLCSPFQYHQVTTRSPNPCLPNPMSLNAFFLNGLYFYLEDGLSRSPQNVSAYHTTQYHIIEDSNLHITCLKLVDILVT